MEDKALITLPHDLVSGLDSLLFEKAFKENKATYIKSLRYSCQIINVSICVYAMYFINTLDAIKKAIILKELSKSNTSKVPKKDIPGIHIGVIGCGTLGQQIIRCLLNQNTIQPCNLVISTRRPEMLEEFKRQGITCINDNLEVCRFAEVLLICIPPSQLSLLSTEIREHLPTKCIVYSILAGQNTQKLSRMLGTYNVYKLNISLNENNTDYLKWKQKNRIIELLSDPEKINIFQPFRDSDSLIEGSNMLPAIIMYAAINLCFAISSRTAEEILVVVQTVIFDNLPMDEDQRIWIEDFDNNLSTSNVVNIIISKGTIISLLQKIKRSSILQEGFCKVFKQHCYVPSSNKETEWNDIKKSLNID